MNLAVLRATTGEALPFIREKLRAALVIAGVRPAAAGQITSVVSQRMRGLSPVALTVLLESHPPAIVLHPRALAGPHQRIELPRAPAADVVEDMRATLARLTREELLHDLERQVQDRTAELAFERERSERLLKNMLPEVIAERMKGGELIADSHDATVLFADIHGFTTWARQRNPHEVVSVLDMIFRNFDEIMHRHGLEKIKTMGDAYMAAAGLPTPQFDHVDRAVLAGLDIIASLPGLRAETGVEIDFRVGVHTGSVVAGVIGAQKLFYDLWGDTVNVASRMESHGRTGMLHVSDDVRRLIGRRYRVEARGVMEIKNRGRMRTWFVLGPAVLKPRSSTAGPA
jgi:class 3 adenylate cyclase